MFCNIVKIMILNLKYCIKQQQKKNNIKYFPLFNSRVFEFNINFSASLNLLLPNIPSVHICICQ